VAYDVVYNQISGDILFVRRAAAPGEDLVLGPGQARVFAEVDLERRSLAGYRVDPATGRVAARRNWVEPTQDAALELGVDVAERSPDGNVDIPADGQSQVRITVQKRSRATGRALGRVRDNERLSITTTAGTLSTRALELRRGRAEFTLRSSVETVVAEVRVRAEGIPASRTILVEFAPTGQP
jgi:hypothetical protein